MISAESPWAFVVLKAETELCRLEGLDEIDLSACHELCPSSGLFHACMIPSIVPVLCGTVTTAPGDSLL